MPTVRHSAARDVITVLVRGWKLTVGFPVAFGVIALLLCLPQTPVYEATVTMYVTSGGDVQSPAAPYEGVMGAAARVNSYARLVYSDVVLSRAVKIAGLNTTVDQAKSVVRSQIVPETVMVSVSAKDQNPEVAQRFANALARSMTETVATLEVPNGGGPPTSRLTVVTPATVNPHPVSPATVIDVALAAIGGLLVGVATALTRERLNNTVRDEQDIEKVVGVRPLGRIPRDKVLGDERIIDFGVPGSAAAAFRHLRTAMSVAHSERSPATILVASPREGEGKSTVAVNLAAAFAESGKSVVVVDADFGNPVVAKRTGNSEGSGLADAIHSQVPPLQLSAIDGLKVISAGRVRDDDDPADLLASSACGLFFGQLAGSFDYVVVDSPSLFDGPEAEAAARWADGVLLVARRGASKISDCAGAITQLSDIGAEMVGVVLNDVRRRRGRERAAPPFARRQRRHRSAPSRVPETV